MLQSFNSNAVAARSGTGSSIFEKVSVTSEAVVALNQTLIVTGLNQRERLTSRSGVLNSPETGNDAPIPRMPLYGVPPRGMHKKTAPR